MSNTIQDRTEIVLRSGRFDAITVASARMVIDSKDYDLSRVPVTKRYYMGTWGEAGHYFFTPGRNGRPHRASTSEAAAINPWKYVDGKLNHTEVEGEASLHHALDSAGKWWTGIGFANRSDDHRGGCNGNFIFDSRLSFDEALADAKEHFSKLFDHWNFEVRLISDSQRTRRR